MFNRGNSQCRFSQNPLEQRFAEAWDRRNKRANAGWGVLDYLFAEKNVFPHGEVTERDRMVAATIIQWLGSPVGQEFLRDVVKPLVL
jgi:hypothetical protein